MAAPWLSHPDAAAALRRGGVLLLATDTLPGLHARADHPEAVARVQALKGRQQGKPLLVLAADLNQALAVLAPLEDRVLGLCRRCWPGPFTLILAGGGRTAPGVAGRNGTLAVRVPADAPLRRLVAAVGFPVVSTSVNMAGQPACRDLTAAVELFGDRIDGVWSSNSPVEPGAVPSCLADLTGPEPRILRPGPQPFPGGGKAPA